MARGDKFLYDLRMRECRTAARKILTRFHVETPDAIDLETIAWHVGKLRVKEGGLTGAEGRLIATSSRGGVIRVALMSKLGRRRFTIAHEIGHFVLHQSNVIDRTIDKHDLTVWTSASEEAEANCFAAELLMPEYLMKPLCNECPSIEFIDKMSKTFKTSVMATMFQYWEYTNEPIAVVLSDGWDMRGFRPFKESWPRIRFGKSPSTFCSWTTLEWQLC